MGFLLRGRARARTKLAVGICPIPPSHRDYLRRHHEIEGWIEHAAAHVIAYLSLTDGERDQRQHDGDRRPPRPTVYLAGAGVPVWRNLAGRRPVRAAAPQLEPVRAGRPRAPDGQSGTTRAECTVHPDYCEFGHAGTPFYPQPPRSTVCVDRWRAQPVHYL